MKKGMLIVLSGPSGVGKGTVRGQIIKNDPNRFKYSVSMTTRNMRPGEIDGVDYFFVNNSEFEKQIKDGKLLEHAQYVGNYYGTPEKYVDDLLNQGHDVLLEIEIDGASQIRKKRPEGIFIFLLPPHLEDLRDRIKNRGTEDDAVVEKRIEKAKKEMEYLSEYDYAIVNDEVENAVAHFDSIIDSEHHKVKRILEDK